MDYIYHYASPLGKIVLASDGTALTGLWFEGQKYFGSTLASGYVVRVLPIFDQTDQWLDIYFSGRAPGPAPPLAMQGTPFRRAVWEIMRTIPFGQTMTYKAIAQELARQRGLDSMSAHAVGNAVAHNPISLIVPCHRVVGTDGSLTGYAGGLDKKVQLLTMEGVDMEKLSIPVKGTAL